MHVHCQFQLSNLCGQSASCTKFNGLRYDTLLIVYVMSNIFFSNIYQEIKMFPRCLKYLEALGLHTDYLYLLIFCFFIYPIRIVYFCFLLHVISAYPCSIVRNVTHDTLSQ